MLARDTQAVVATFAVSGAVHLVKPQVYEPLMPSWVPAHRQVILASGYAELACAAGLLLRPTRRLAGGASAALLLAVFVGNLKMADDARRSGNRRFQALAYGRLPLQAPLVRGALRAARG